MAPDLFADNVPERDAAVVERLRAAGAVLVAKLSAIQLAGAGGYRHASTSLNGVGRNPWNEHHWSGGSSSGSAIAVSAGLLPFAIGTETTGSVLVPAAFCGVTGFRPSWGAVSQRGMLPVAWSLDKPGVVARTAVDCGAVQALVGEDPEDPTTSAFHLQSVILPPFSIGVLDIGLDGFPESADRFRAAVEVLRVAGDRTVRVTPPPGPYQETVRTILAGETAASQGWIVRTGKVHEMLDGSQRSGLRASLRQTAAAYSSATRTRVELVAGLRSVFHSHDAIVAPTHLRRLPIGTDLKDWAPRRRHLGAIGALGGYPGVTVPIGFGPAGLPLGMTVLADRGRDLAVLAVAERFQTLTDWHRQSPESAS